MTQEEYVGECKRVLKQELNNYFEQKESMLVSLLKEIIIVEKSSATPETIINQLKESYYPSGIDSCRFVMGLYNHDKKVISEYINIVSEVVLTDEEDKDISTITGLISSITPELEPVLNNKINQTIKL